MRFFKASIPAGLLVMLCACGLERSAETRSKTPPADHYSLDADTQQANRRLFSLERRLQEIQAGHAILIEALSHQNLPLDRAVIEKLKRNSGITLQWIGNNRGTVTVTESRDGVVSLRGRQVGADGRSTLSLEGRVVLTTPSAFLMVGTIDHDVQSLRESGEPRCHREGAFTFRITGDRKYWRLLEKTRHCGLTTDYVDIFF